MVISNKVSDRKIKNLKRYSNSPAKPVKARAENTMANNPNAKQRMRYDVNLKLKSDILFVIEFKQYA
ncbi:hypothetical protein ACJRPK_07315 [Aquimarina sp. 2-A2]|uniref:Uncharacterized protein n=1 Tax=Aquimarina intermedia TaxID=350814 RepID=A0A5S5C6Z6_9FLAO|nr:hypothetical protein [Aquimarina intermedia]TYP75067.1 hypothetical protein BD809_103129 [Aquimarina intermedia]